MQAGRPPLEAQRLVSGYRAYQMMVAACELKLPDLLAAGPMGVGELASETQTHLSSLRRFLRGLAVLGIVTEEPDGRFAATALAGNFRSDRPGLRNMTLMQNDEGYRAWADLLYTLRTGEPAFHHLFGKSPFDKLGENSEASARFNAAMVEGTTRIAGAFVAAYDFSGVRTVVDVAGGNGALLAVVLNAHPDMRGVLFDLAQGLAGAGENLEAQGVGSRTSLVEGSFFESVPHDGDLYMLKSIIHDWDDEQAVAILKTCRRAMQPQAKLVLLERTVPERADTSQAAFEAAMGDLQMMVVLGGRERSVAEYGDLLAQAGFQMSRFVRTESPFGVVEGVPAE